jgi:hypothetical protein
MTLPMGRVYFFALKLNQPAPRPITKAPSA